MKNSLHKITRNILLAAQILLIVGWVQTQAATTTDAAESASINVVFFNNCPIGLEHGSAAIARAGKDVIFQRLISDGGTSKDKTFEIILTPFTAVSAAGSQTVRERHQSDPNTGRLTLHVMDWDEMPRKKRNKDWYSYVFTIYSDDCDPVDPLIIIEK